MIKRAKLFFKIPQFKTNFKIPKFQIPAKFLPSEPPYPFALQAFWFIALWVLAFAVRETVFSVGGYSRLGGDEGWYMYLTRRIVKSGWMDDYVWLPGWPIFLSLFFKSGGTETLRHITMIIASINCALVFLIGLRLWNPRAGLIAGLIMCFFPEHVFFSHYIYAEIGLELIILVFTLLVAVGIKSVHKIRYLYAAYFILSLGMLYKHFVVLPFVALTGYLFFKGERKLILKLSLLFLLPTLLFSSYLALKGNDPFFWMNIPLKNAREWGAHQPMGGIRGADRSQYIAKHIANKRRWRPISVVVNTWHNVRDLWTPNSYVIARLFRKSYDLPEGIFTSVIVHYYTIVFLLGVCALIFSYSDFFRGYTVTILLLLTAMSLMWFMVSRFRVPFLFLYALSSARLITHFGQYKLAVKYSDLKDKLVFAAVIITVVQIYVVNIPRLGKPF